VLLNVVTEVNAHRAPRAGRCSRRLDESTRWKNRATRMAKTKAPRKLPGAWGEMPARVPTVAGPVQFGRVEGFPWKHVRSARRC
jgi:hypothetical protein